MQPELSKNVQTRNARHY